MTIILLRASTFLIHLQWSSKCEIASLHPGLKCLTLKLTNSSVKYLLFSIEERECQPREAFFLTKNNSLRVLASLATPLS